MRGETLEALVDRFGEFEVVVEVGVGNRPDVAEALADRCEVRATDIVERDLGPDVAFHVDDVTDPEPAVYAGAEAIYALNPPPELHRPILDLAERHDSTLAFTTLGGDAPAVPVQPETLPGETLFWATGAVEPVSRS